jgi:hypothetical protein
MAWYMITCGVLVTKAPKTSPALPAVASPIKPVKDQMKYLMVQPR